MMAGITILQLIEAHERIYKEKDLAGQPIQRLDSSEVANILSKAFGIEDYVSLSLVEEFAEFEFVSVTGDDGFDVAVFPDMHRIVPMPKMYFILVKALYDIAYLNMCAMRIPLPVKVLKCDVPYFVANTFEIHSTGVTKTSLTEWIGAKITNSIGMYRLIMALAEEMDRHLTDRPTKFTKRIKNTFDKTINKERTYNDCIFSFCGTLEGKILTSIKDGILEGLEYPDKHLPQILHKIKAYKTKWEVI